ncbi:MAG: ribosome-associated translation inhibitor RaiA [Paludibacteraceae bacterium]|nr:ribosome-associated translation inhibitor RaiA [Paludibacteraceae bacterium]
MKLNVQAVNFDIAEKLEKYIEKKTRKFEKILDDSAELDIRLKVVKRETNMNKESQATLRGLGGEFFAQKTADTFEEGIDDILEAVARQIKKYKEKMQH